MKCAKVIRVAVLALAALSFSSCEQINLLLGNPGGGSNGPTPNGTVEEMGTGNPMEGATVTLEETGSTTTTDSLGYWEFDLDPTFGTVTLFAEKAEYQFYVAGGLPEGDLDNEYDASLSDIRLTLQLIDDYIIESLSVTDAAFPGESIDVSVQVTNDSRQDLLNLSVKMYLSGDTVITVDDEFLWFTTLDVASRQTSTADFSFVLSGSATSGAYYIGALVDYVGDSDDSNNTASSAFTVPAGLDLKDVQVDPTNQLPATLAVGSTVTMFHSIKNYGSGVSTAFVSRVYLSADTVLDTLVDTEIGFSTTPAGFLGGGGATSTPSTPITVPLDAVVGDYYIIIVCDADGDVLEFDETNNIGISASPIAITAN